MSICICVIKTVCLGVIKKEDEFTVRTVEENHLQDITISVWKIFHPEKADRLYF